GRAGKSLGDRRDRIEHGRVSRPPRGQVGEPGASRPGELIAVDHAGDAAGQPVVRHERRQRRLELRSARRDQITVTAHTRDDGRSREPDSDMLDHEPAKGRSRWPGWTSTEWVSSSRPRGRDRRSFCCTVFPIPAGCGGTRCRPSPVRDSRSSSPTCADTGAPTNPKPSRPTRSYTSPGTSWRSWPTCGSSGPTWWAMTGV